MYQTHLVLFYKTAKFEIPPIFTRIKDLNPYRIGGVFGFNYVWYDGKINLDTGAKTREALVEKLHLGRVDFAILQKEVLFALHHKGKVDLKGLGSIPDLVKPTKAYRVLTVKSPRGKILQEIINKGIDQLTLEGTTRNIMKKYIGEKL